MNNPFTLSFGKKPNLYISRLAQTEQIIDSFTSENPISQSYMITGVRGSGKTVLMTNIAAQIAEDKSWIVVELNPTRDLLNSLAAKLYAIKELNLLFLKAKFDFSAFGFGASIEQSPPITDIEDALSKMLETIKKHKKRVLVTIDEATNSEHLRVFASSFQIFLRQDMPIFLLMTGLYENIYELQNDKSLTFLYRSPKLVLEPLNLTAVKDSYARTFNISDEKAAQMTALTKGYPFAYQVLGYLFWEKSATCDMTEILSEYDQYLDEYVYEKIWSELSELDKNILIEMSDVSSYRVKDLREKLNMTSELFAVYRDRLKRKGLLDTQEYGKVKLALPRFAEFIKIRSL